MNSRGEWDGGDYDCYRRDWDGGDVAVGGVGNPTVPGGVVGKTTTGTSAGASVGSGGNTSSSSSSGGIRMTTKDGENGDE